MSIWLKLSKLLVGKAVLFLSICLIVLLFFVCSHFINEWIGTAERRLAHWEEVKATATASLNEMQQRKSDLQKDIDQRKLQLDQSKRRLDELNYLWTRIKNIFNSEEQKRRKAEIEQQILEQELAESKIRNELASNESEIKVAQSEIEKAQDEMKQADAILSERKTTVSDARQIIIPWVKKALITGLIIFLIVVLMPYAYGILGYYVFAPIISHSDPLHLADYANILESSATDSRPSLKILLDNKHEMVAKEEFLQGSQGDLEKSTCWIWKWKYPFACIVCELVMLTRIRNTTSKDGEVSRITFSHQKQGLLEISKISIPENGALVIRPRFIAGLVYERSKEPRIISKWVFNRLHSWVTFQFRYFIIEGPVDVIVAAGRGIQTEQLDENCPNYRINRNLTIGFSPALCYNSVRAETLMAYLRKRNPLFDDNFSGHGTIYNQQTSVVSDETSNAEGYWGKFLSGLGKVLGL